MMMMMVVAMAIMMTDDFSHGDWCVTAQFLEHFLTGQQSTPVPFPLDQNQQGVTHHWPALYSLHNYVNFLLIQLCIDHVDKGDSRTQESKHLLMATYTVVFGCVVLTRLEWTILCSNQKVQRQ